MKGLKSPKYHLEVVLERDFSSSALLIPAGEKIIIFPHRQIIFSVPVLTRRGMFFIRKSFITITLKNQADKLEQRLQKKIVRFTFVEKEKLLPLLSSRDKKLANL